MAEEIGTDNITFGFGVFGVVVLCIIVLALLWFFRTNIIEIFSKLFLILTNFFVSFFKNNEPIVNSDICSIVPSGDPVPKVPSLFVAHLAFFFGFLLANAIYLYKYKNDDTQGIENYVNNRKYRAGTAIFLLCVVFLSILILRYFTTNCESPSGILFTSIIFGSLGNLWYKIGEVCGLKLTDIFGVSQSIISTTSQAPLVCSP